ncbi:hypothetical protein CVT25_001772 [Psilocybe cyanescens]|uniref:PAS domain-containing protein n=1 Tax=Psilocybe cyanescens TaxID=93625 RepID=A0A409WPK2_PSICY|nr:hypothetical protein CVT25_001772 [Psilocybe cyanescens]
MNTPTPCLSFIGIVDFSQEVAFSFEHKSPSRLLTAFPRRNGYEPHELIGRPSLELVHPDEFPRVKQLHYDTIQQDKAAVLVYLRMKHKDRFKGYVLMQNTLFKEALFLRGARRTVVHNVLVGSVSFASPGAKALQNASTAQEITVISPVASNFEFRRWHDPSPMPPSPIPPSMAIPQALPMAMALPASPSPSASSWSSSRSPRGSSSPLSPGLGGLRHRSDSGGSASSGRRSRASSRSSLSVSPERRAHTSHIRRGSGGGEPNANTTTTGSTHARGDSNAVPIISFPHLSNKSFRTALILDRFSAHCTIMYCSNDLLISSSDAIGCSFYDFVDAPDEAIVRDWINTVKGWGVNEKGQPSDGGFGFGKFCLITERRDSIERMPDPPSPSRNRRASTSRGATANSRAGRHPHHRGQHHTAASRTAPALTARSAARTAARPQSQSPPQEHARLGLGLGTSQSQAQCEKFKVDAIFSAHSDGLMVILRRA